MSKQKFEDKVFVHYGQAYFKHQWFQPISNRSNWNKPNGGLWCSDEKSPNNWAKFCKNTDWDGFLSESFKVKPKKDANILIIDTPQKVDNINPGKTLHSFCGMITNLNFKEAAKIYDGIYVDLTANWRNGHKDDIGASLYDRLYGWDVDSLLVMNPNAFTYSKEIKEK